MNANTSGKCIFLVNIVLQILVYALENNSIDDLLCVMPVWVGGGLLFIRNLFFKNTYTYTHTHIHIDAYTYICIHVYIP